MKKNSALKVFALLAVSFGLLPIGGIVDAGAMPIAAPQTSNILVAAADDCAAVAKDFADKQGGKVASVTPSVRNGAPVCIVVVLVPGRDGERPRRVEQAVPNR